LFGTSVDAVAWPAPELVWLYFSRAVLENRFAQIKAELGIDRLFCCKLGGQWLATLVGLLLWNLRTILGAEHEGKLPAMPQLPARRQSVEVTPAKLAQGDPPATRPPPLAELNSQLTKLNWTKFLAERADWNWSVTQGLRCPVGKEVLPQSFHADKQRLTYRTRESDCGYCPQRQQCFAGREPDRDRLILSIGVAQLKLPVDKTSAAIRLAREQSLPGPWLPPVAAEPGSFEADMPHLLPAWLRARFLQALCGAHARVEVTLEKPVKRPAWRAGTAAQRQHRRLTWAERLARNALPPGSQVHAHLTVRDNGVGNLLRGGA
jgi:hypothetical protein